MRYRELRGFKGDLVYRYTSSIDHDHNIYRHVVKVMGAHLIALKEAGVLSRDDYSMIARELVELWHGDPAEVLKGDYEDVFEAIESRLHESIGPKAGWIALGRSRNDHVSAVLRLYTIEALAQVSKTLVNLREKLLDAALKYFNAILPGYTHGQPSQVISGACLFQAYEEALSEANEVVLHAIQLASKSPLGSGAGGGTMVDLDEDLLARLLGFRDKYSSPYHAVASRMFLHYAAQSLALVMVEVSRIAEDLISLSQPGVEIVELPEEHIATSSIMPHKANPVTLEIMRARASEALASLHSIAAIQLKLRYSYNLDLQEANRHLYNLAATTIQSIEALTDLITGISINEDKALEVLHRYKPWTAEVAEKHSLESKIPLRQAYEKTAQSIMKGTLQDLNPQEILEIRRTGCTLERTKERIRQSIRKMEEHKKETIRHLETIEKTTQTILQKLQNTTNKTPNNTP